MQCSHVSCMYALQYSKTIPRQSYLSRTVPFCDGSQACSVSFLLSPSFTNLWFGHRRWEREWVCKSRVWNLKGNLSGVTAVGYRWTVSLEKVRVCLRFQAARVVKRLHKDTGDDSHVLSRCRLVWLAAKQNSMSAQDADVFPQVITKLAG